MKRFFHRDLFGVRVIGAWKLVSGVVAFVMGIGILVHRDFNLADGLTHIGSRLRLDPGNRFVHQLIAAASGLHEEHLQVLGIAAILYAILHLIEGIGLLLERRWAGYLTVIATSGLIPLEAYELVRRVNALRLFVILVNLGIVFYLVMRLRQENRAWSTKADKPATKQ